MTGAMVLSIAGFVSGVCGVLGGVFDSTTLLGTASGIMLAANVLAGIVEYRRSK